MLKPLDLYTLMTVWSSLMILYDILEVNFSPVSKGILYDFVCRKIIPSIYKSMYSLVLL